MLPRKRLAASAAGGAAPFSPDRGAKDADCHALRARNDRKEAEGIETIDRQLMAARWYKRLLEENNKAFIPLFFDQSRYLVLKGGGGSGKSIFAGRKILERVTTEKGHRWLVVRKVARTLRESCFEQLKGQAYEHYGKDVAFIPRGKGSDMYIRFKNGSEIIFAGLDDVEKLKSIYDITGIWIEEASEITEADFNQLDIRLRTNFTHYLQIILTFNPISITHWLKKRFFDFDIEDETERQRAIARTRTHESTYHDNRFLSERDRQTLEAFKATDEYYYTVYCLGEWGVTGKTVFNGRLLTERLQKLTGYIKRGFFEYDEEGTSLSNIRWVDDANGPVKIYREAEKRKPYVIGADTAGEGSDWFVGQVLDNVTGRQVCTVRHQYEEDTFAKQLYCIGRYYNWALIAPEVNFSTFPTKLLEMLGYEKLYVRETEDNFDGKIRHAYGFRTDRLTRPNIIANLVSIMRTHTELLEDRDTIEEMLSFVRNEKLRAEAEPGAHDDCVMALAIAYYVRPQQSMRAEEEETETVVWREDQWEDYYSADEETRKYLVKKWGRPKR